MPPSRAIVCLLATSRRNHRAARCAVPAVSVSKLSNVNLELIDWPLLARPGVQAHLIGLQQHRQVLSQHLPNVVFQGLCPTIVVGEGETILGDPGNYLVLIEVSGQVDGPDARSASCARPGRTRVAGLLSSGFRKRAEGKESPWLLLLLADVYARR